MILGHYLFIRKGCTRKNKNKKNIYLFCYFSRLDKFFTLKKTNSFAFSSLNQNFALSLHA